MEPTLRDLLARRPFALALLVSTTFVGLGAQRLFGVVLPRLVDPPMLIAGIALIAWVMLELVRRRAELAELAREARLLGEAAEDFPGRVDAWLVGEGADGEEELEAQALREALGRRHQALVAAVRARLRHEEPARDDAVLAHTHAAERGEHTGKALVDALVALQRESLAEAQRRGFIAVEQQLLLERSTTALQLARPVDPDPAPSDRVLSTLVGVYAAILPIGSSHRMAAVGLATFAGLALVLFEALATAPVRVRCDPRPAALSPR